MKNNIDIATFSSARTIKRISKLEANISHIFDLRWFSPCAQVVMPHPNFRLILAMDTKYGDLSRAMRNRGVEVWTAMVTSSDCLGS